MITYRSIRGYKYQLVHDYVCETGIDLSIGVASPGGYITIDRSGSMTIRSGYAWDGASGPTWDSPSTMRGSLVHDCWYQLFREGTLSVAL